MPPKRKAKAAQAPTAKKPKTTPAAGSAPRTTRFPVRWIVPRHAATLPQTPRSAIQTWAFSNAASTRASARSHFHALRNAIPERSQASVIPSPPVGRGGRRIAPLLRCVDGVFRGVGVGYGMERLWRVIERGERAQAPGSGYLGRVLEGLEEEEVALAYLRRREEEGDAGFEVVRLASDFCVAVDLGSEGSAALREEVRVYRVEGSGFNEEQGYFIDLDPHQAIRVNGAEFSNGADEGILVIGPLVGFTVLEILGQPIFLWRRQADSEYQVPVATANSGGRGYNVRGVAIYTQDTVVSISKIRKEDLTSFLPLGGRRHTIGERTTRSMTATAGPISGKTEPASWRGLVADSTQFHEYAFKTNPCAYYRTMVKELLKREDVREHMDQMRTMHSASFETADEDETTLAIASVVLAVNEALPAHEGFSLTKTAEIRTIRPRQRKRNDMPVINRGRPRILCFSPRRIPGQFVLLIMAHNGYFVTAELLDSRVWTRTLEDREAFHDVARDFSFMTGWKPSDGPEYTYWMPAAQQYEPWTSGFYAVLNAWALTLGLELDPHFHPADPESFCAEARQMMLLARGGFIDWRIIWAFLRCHRFIFAGQEVPTNRRFAQTIPQFNQGANTRTLEALLKQEIEQLTEGEKLPVKGSGASGLILPIGVPHDYPFPTDDWDEESRGHIARELLQAGLLDISKSNAETRKAYKALTNQPPTPPKQKLPELPKDFQACQYFETKREALLKDDQVKALLTRLKRQDPPPTEVGLYLSDFEVACPVVSVLQAINEERGEERGFALASNSHVLAVRPREPVIVPWVHNSHIVLLVVQFDGTRNGIDFSVLDSRIWHYDKKDRDQIYGDACRFLEDQGWFHGDIQWKKKHARWVRVAQQPNPWSCGYYTVLNAWALALGLELNREFQPPEDEAGSQTFFERARDLVLLARAGVLDWTLIYAFLRCYKFVRTTREVPRDRYFSTTTSQMDETEHSETLLSLRAETEAIILSLSGNLPSGNPITVVVPRGRRHNENFPSDSWNEGVKGAMVPDLLKAGILDFEMTNKEIMEAWEAMF